LVVAYKYLVRLHLGEPRRKAALPVDATTLPAGRMNYRFPVDLGKLLRYLDVKRDESELEITLTHVAVKATALALAEVPALKGHVIGGNFYPTRLPAVDLSVSYEVSEKETVVLKINDADAKPLELITDEINVRGLAIRKSGKIKPPSTLRSQILGVLPSSLSAELDSFLLYLGSQFGASIPLLGVERFPLGVCTVLTSPNQDGESDMDIMVIPGPEAAATPITVTIGGIRLLPSMDSERRLAGAPVLNFTISIDSKAGSLAEGRKFSAKLQQFLNDPELIDKADAHSARQREDASKRKSMFG
jgi:pyruvate/2-oxoglutarate dehydrogenase complex dihydrolipoamide acyltransferase (E2) component